MLLKIYQITSFLASPLIKLYLKHRKNKGKEDSKRFSERFGHASIPRPSGKLIWFHAASVGESISVLPLINKLSKLNESVNFLITTGTTSSAKIVESKLPEKAFHQYIPVDTPFAVNRFLKHWKPDLSVFVESELWPNLVISSAKQSPVILINGRVSDASYKNWKKYNSLGKKLLNSFTFILAQSRIDYDRFKSLGADNVKYFGNLKFDSPALPSDPKKMGELVSQIGERHVWLAASTHANEEEMISKIHKELKEEHPDLLTIIAPRHIKRATEIANIIKEKDLKCAIRSKNEEITKDIDIYLADTMGELGVFYRLVSLVFIGGSLVDKGGQNPLEASKLDCAVLYGKYMSNFSEINSEMQEKHASISVENSGELKNILNDLMRDHSKQEELAKAAKDLVKEKSGITNAVINEIQEFIGKTSDDI